jgi:hypothetical protein
MIILVAINAILNFKRFLLNFFETGLGYVSQAGLELNNLPASVSKC